MGWAKYAEDVFELVSEREKQLNQKTIDAEIKIAVCFENPKSFDEKKQTADGNVEYSDIKIVCRDCGKKFLFPIKSQRYFDKQEWEYPKRCKCCREHRNTVFLMHASH